MPPAVKFTKEEIVNAALQVVRNKGAAALTTRQIAAELGVSTRPIFTYFQNMQQVQEAVRQAAQNLYHSYIQKGMAQEHPFAGVGEQYIRFAMDEPELYRLLFLSAAPGSTSWAAEEMQRTQDMVLDSIRQIYRMDEETAKRYFRDVWLMIHGIATLIVTGGCTYTDQEISDMLTGISISICKAIKEVPGFVDGSFEKDAVFRKLIAE